MRQAWEVLHLATYYRKLLTVYAKLSSILEVDLSLARQTQREALSPGEVDVASSALAVVQEHQDALEEAWRGVRWIRDVLSFARLKKNVGINMAVMDEWYSNQPDTPDDSQFSNAESMNLQIKSANVFRLDTLKNWNTRKRDSASSDSGALGGRGLSRTPTTRSDPLEFNVLNKENEGTNLAHVRTRLMQDGTPLAPQPTTDQPSSYSSLNYSVSSANSIDSNDNEYEGKTSHRPSDLITNQSAGSPEPNILQVYAAYDTG